MEGPDAMREADGDADRGLLRGDLWERLSENPSDAQRGLPAPPLETPAPSGARRFGLIPPGDLRVGDAPFSDLLERRRSHRSFSDVPLSAEQLSFLLWATQGVKEVMARGTATRRTVPSAGARHALETYLMVMRVEGFAPGLYRYLALEHQLCQLRGARPEDGALLVDACGGQRFCAECAACFLWTAIPYRMEWRYGPVAPKLIALDAGHVCENLYLACEAMGLGTCAVAAFDQGKTDAFLGVDGREEFALYLAPVGCPD